MLMICDVLGINIQDIAFSEIALKNKYIKLVLDKYFAIS